MLAGPGAGAGAGTGPRAARRQTVPAASPPAPAAASASPSVFAAPTATARLGPMTTRLHAGARQAAPAPGSADPTLERCFRGHTATVHGLAFKPTLTQIASAAADHAVLLWHFRPQRRAFRFLGHKDAVTSIAFRDDGARLASASKDRTVRVWAPTLGAEVTVWTAHPAGAVRAVAFSRDGPGSRLLTASDDKTMKLWNAGSTKFETALTGHVNWVRTAAWAPGSATLLVSGSDDRTVKLWDARLPKPCVHTYHDHTGLVTSVAYHAHGTMVASGATDGTIKLFDVRVHRLVQHYVHQAPPASSAAHSGRYGVTSIALNDAGDALLSAGMDGALRLWDMAEGRLRYTLRAHRAGTPATAVAFAPGAHGAAGGGTYFASGGGDSQVLVWRDSSSALDGSEGPLPLSASASTAHHHSHGHAESAAGMRIPRPRSPVRHSEPRPRTERRDPTDAGVPAWPSTQPHVHEDYPAIPTVAPAASNDRAGVNAAVAGGATRPAQSGRSMSPHRRSQNAGVRHVRDAETQDLRAPAAETLDVDIDVDAYLRAAAATPDAASRYHHRHHHGRHHEGEQGGPHEASYPREDHRPAVATTAHPAAEVSVAELSESASQTAILHSLTRTVGQLAQQMDIMTQTLAILEQRLTLNEERLMAQQPSPQHEPQPSPEQRP